MHGTNVERQRSSDHVGGALLAMPPAKHAGHWWASTVAPLNETWQSIADSLAVTKAKLLAANGLATARPLLDGEQLHLPFETTGVGV